MSKLGKKIIVLPKDSTIKVESGNLLVSGPKGSKKVQFNEKLFSSKVNDVLNSKLLNSQVVSLGLKIILSSNSMQSGLACQIFINPAFW